MELVLRNSGMKFLAKAALILFASGLWLLVLSSAAAQAGKPMSVKIGRGEAQVTLLQGTAQVLSMDGKRRSLKVGHILKGGDQVDTGPKSRLEIVLPDRTLLRFADNTSFKIIQIDVSEAANTRNAKVNVALGKTWVNVGKTLGVKPKIEVSCENAVAGVRGTIYRMNVNDDRSALIRVYDGEVAVSGGGKPAEQTPAMGPPEKISGPVSVPGPRKVSMEEWVYIVQSMQQIRVSSAGVPDQPETFTDEDDREDWVDWNKARDAETGRTGELPEETGSSGFVD